MNISPTDVSITLSHRIDGRGQSDAFYFINAHIRVNNDNEAGYISAVLIDRSRIRRGMFLSAMDAHSSELQEISVMFFEPRLGRTRVRLLREEGQDRNPIMYIEKVHVAEQYVVNGNSDVGTYALYQFLRHAYVTSWNFCMCLYILDGPEMMDQELRDQIRSMDSTERKRLVKQYQRLDANQFLRNGFYQDRTIATIAPHCVVAARSHWSSPLKSHNEVETIQYHVPPPNPEPPTGKDEEILELTKSSNRHLDSAQMSLSAVDDFRQTIEGMQERITEMEELIQNAQANGEQVLPNLIEMIQLFNRQIDNFHSPTLETALAEYRRDVQGLIEEGGTLCRSNALHAACALDNSHLVTCILSMDQSTLESRDANDYTPLMVAAETMSGRSNVHSGFPTNHDVIDILLANGADKDAVKRDGMTAYGTFVNSHRKYTESIFAMMGQQIPAHDTTPGYEAVAEKLMPTRGATRADITGGASEDAGLISYDREQST
jgi:hypothetical protein